MSKKHRKMFTYKGTDLESGQSLIDEQVTKWAKEHQNCKITGLKDERSINYQDESDSICIINTIIEYEER